MKTAAEKEVKHTEEYNEKNGELVIDGKNYGKGWEKYVDLDDENEPAQEYTHNDKGKITVYYSVDFESLDAEKEEQREEYEREGGHWEALDFDNYVNWDDIIEIDLDEFEEN